MKLIDVDFIYVNFSWYYSCVVSMSWLSFSTIFLGESAFRMAYNTDLLKSFVKFFLHGEILQTVS